MSVCVYVCVCITNKPLLFTDVQNGPWSLCPQWKSARLPGSVSDLQSLQEAGTWSTWGSEGKTCIQTEMLSFLRLAIKSLSSSSRGNILVFPHDASCLLLHKDGGSESVSVWFQSSAPLASERLIQAAGFSWGTEGSRAVVRRSGAPGDHTVSSGGHGRLCADPLYNAGQAVQTGNEGWFSAAGVCGDQEETSVWTCFVFLCPNRERRLHQHNNQVKLKDISANQGHTVVGIM